MAESTPTPDSETRSPAAGEELVAVAAGDEILDRLIGDALGERIAEVMRVFRRAEEARRRRAHPEEGLRERKRRVTRQLISDVAAAMFATRGFDDVKVSEVADRVGVSEKTIYNYFPSKEALVLDNADESLERLTRTLRERRAGESLTEAVLRALEADADAFDDAPEELIEFIPRFIQMIDGTPTLRAAWLELHDRVAKVIRDEIAAQAEIDPSNPEPMIAGRALAGLVDVAFESRVRHISAGLRGQTLRNAVNADLERAARLLDVGLWSLNLLARGAKAKRQALEAVTAADQARAQVVKALKQARAAWSEVHRHA
jgi:AcrR family transcriptional regulator